MTKKALSLSLKEIMQNTAFSKITIENICENAGISRRNFYRYFPDKYELLNWTYYNDFIEGVSQKEHPRTIDLIPDVVRHLEKNREFYLRAFDVTGQNSFRDFCYERLYPYMDRDYGSVFPDQRSKEFVFRRIINGVFDSYQEWMRQDRGMSAEEYADYLVGMIKKFAVKFAEVAENDPK